MSDKPILFLDVDGVLNCQGYACPVDELQVIDNVDRVETVFIPKGMKDRIDLLRMEFEIVWATAWEGAAHTAFREYLDLPQESWPYVPFLGKKLQDIMRWAGNRAWAWVDDLAAWELKELGWSDYADWEEDGIHIRPHRFFKDNTMIVSPSGMYGLTDHQTYKLLKFAKEQKWQP